jgi:hypothetical protein
MNDLAQTEQRKLAKHRHNVLEMEAFLKELPQTEIETRHTFGGGVYMREMRAPADTVMTGVIHRYETMNVLVSGTIVMGTPDGPKELTGPMTFPTPAGTKNIGVTITDVIWINAIPTDLTDVEEIEKELFVPDFETLALESNQ